MVLLLVLLRGAVVGDWGGVVNVYLSIVLTGLLFWLIVWFIRKLPSPPRSRDRSVSTRGVPRSRVTPQSRAAGDPQAQRVASILSSLPPHEAKSFRSKYDFCRDWPVLLSACLGDVHKAHRLVEVEARRSPTAAPDTLVTYALLSLSTDRR